MRATSVVLVIACSLPLLAQHSHQVTAAMVEKWMTELSNWGRWGKEDQRGTVNLITAAKRKQAAALVKEGLTVSLARTIDTRTAPDNSSPFQHTMQNTGANPLVSNVPTNAITLPFNPRNWLRSGANKRVGLMAATSDASSL